MIEEGQLRQIRSGLTRYSKHLARNPEDAEDLLQETLLRVWLKRDKYQEQTGSTLQGWCNTVMWSIFINGQRTKGRRPPTVGGSQRLPEGIDEREAADEQVLVRDLVRALEGLPPEQLQAILAVAEEKDYRSAARRLQIHAGTLRSRRSRGMAAVKDRIR